MRFDFTDEAFRRAPWPAYADLRGAGGVEYSPETGCYLVTSHAGVKAGLTHPGLAADYPLRASRTLFGENMLDTDGALHRALKRQVNPFFGASSVHRLTPALLEPVVAATVERLAARAGEPFDFVDQVARQVPYLVMTSVMGIPPTDAAWLFRTMRPVVAALDYPPPPDRSAAQRARDELNRYFLGLLERSRDAEGEKTILGQFAELVDADTLTRAHALSSVLLMLVAGTETSISAISSIMHCLLSQPAALDAPIEAMVRESLRWEPPLHSVLRFAAGELEITGVTVPRKRPVLLVLASANRDRSVFEHPDRFDPDRFDRPATLRQTLHFGAGSHACPGSYLAEREFVLLFTALREAFGFETVGPEPPPITGHVFRRPAALPVRVRLRSRVLS